MAQLGLTEYQEVAERARAAGHSLTRARIGQIVADPLREFPKPDSVRALAAALAVTELEVTLAAAESVGLHVESGMTATEQEILGLTAQRSPGEKAALLAAFRAVATTLDAYRRDGPDVTD